MRYDAEEEDRETERKVGWHIFTEPGKVAKPECMRSDMRDVC